MSLVRYAQSLDLFVAVARARSFSAVARRRGAAPSSVVRRVDALEAELGAPLFLRSTRGLTLTDAGQAMLERASRILDDLVDTRAEIAALAGLPQGTLRVSCLPTFGRRHILPWLPGFLTRHDRLAVEMEFTERLGHPSEDRKDAVIRIGDLPDSGLFATRVGTQRWLACASPAYVAAHGAPEDPAGLSGHRLVDKTRGMIGCWRPLLGDGVAAVLRCDDFEALLQAAEAGIGIAFLPDWVAEESLARGRLRILFHDPAGRADPIHVLRALARASVPVRLFTDALRDRLAERGLAG
ncbi:MAG: LysR family transcriptional regulator [Telmatospirillum sp.]|nr:LysR family transcriptional regulator [Telmatospirillum sp.]